MRLYVHIPFCHQVCPYCSFYKHTPGSTSISEFVGALTQEATGLKKSEGKITPTTVYFGGGTPSMLSPTHLRKMFRGLAETFNLPAAQEITLEANPATFDLGKAKLFRELGISRISLGIQSFDVAVLKTLGREHSPAEAVQAVETLREAKIKSVNIDLMFSIPGQSLESWKATLQQAIALRPEHISAYNLNYEEDTEFFESLKSGLFQESEDKDASHYHLAEELLEKAGYIHYETSNYALPSSESQHNKSYWAGDDYVGLGPSAVSTIGSQRKKNLSDTEGYIKMIAKLGHAQEEIENLTSEEQRIERIALGLRTITGIPISLLDEEALAKIQILIDEKMIARNGFQIYLTRSGRALVDPIATELI